MAHISGRSPRCGIQKPRPGPRPGARPQPPGPTPSPAATPGVPRWGRAWAGSRRPVPGCSGSATPAARARPTPPPPARHLRGRRCPPSAAPWTPRPRSRPGKTRNSSRRAGILRGPPCCSPVFRAAPPGPDAGKRLGKGAGPGLQLEESRRGGARAERGWPAARAAPSGVSRPFLPWEKEGGGSGDPVIG